VHRSLVHKQRFTHEALTEPKPPYSALQKDISIGFAMAKGEVVWRRQTATTP
jgi:hypothetical protein